MTVFVWVGFLVVTVMLGAAAVRALLRKQRRDQPAMPAYPPTTLLTTSEASRIWLRRGKLSVPKRAP